MSVGAGGSARHKASCSQVSSAPHLKGINTVLRLPLLVFCSSCAAGPAGSAAALPPPAPPSAPPSAPSTPSTPPAAADGDLLLVRGGMWPTT